jgi:hypothetical protein
VKKEVIFKARALLAQARDDGDVATRATAAAYLKQHHLTEEDIPPWRGLLDISVQEDIVHGLEAGTATREQQAAYYQELALITLCRESSQSAKRWRESGLPKRWRESGLPKRRHFKRWPWLLEFRTHDAPGEKTYEHKAALWLLGPLGGIDDAAMHLFADSSKSLSRMRKKRIAC